MRVMIIHILLIGMSAAFLWLFSNIVKFKGVVLQEPIIPVLYLEVVVFSGCLIFAIVSLVKLVRRH